MTVAAVDIGTNSMRLLILDENGSTLDRQVQVTGLGAGFDTSGRLDEAAVKRTLVVLGGFGESIKSHGCRSARVVATAATRDAENGADFAMRAGTALGHPLEVIPGETEARLAFDGAMAALTAPDDAEPLVVDIGGGSTEFVGRDSAASVRIGSVRLTDRALKARPASFDELVGASEVVEEIFRAVEVSDTAHWMVGVAGTWTSLAGLLRGGYVVGEMHGAVITRLDLDRLIGKLAQLTVAETAELPGLDPKRAPVILAGAVIARQAMRLFGAEQVTISESDLLDALAASQL